MLHRIIQKQKIEPANHHQDRFAQEVWAINYSRIRILTVILFLVCVVNIYINVTYEPFPKLIPIYLIVGAGSLLYWCAALLGERLGFGGVVPWRMFFVLSYSLFIVSVFGFGSILFYDRDLILYMLPVFAVGAFIILRPGLALIFFATVQLAFVVFYTHLVTDAELLWKTIINSTIMIILALSVIIFTYRLRLQEFGHRTTIEERSTVLEKANLKLHEIANTDDLTGLPNRRSFMQSLKQELERARRFKQSLSIMIIDLDHFKEVNDTYGHAAGDATLQHFAFILKKGLREIDIPGRLGGEEFGIILPGTELTGGVEVAERLRQEIEQKPVNYQGSEIYFTLSFGVTAYHEGISSVDVLLNTADEALYEAKVGGRNRTIKK